MLKHSHNNRLIVLNFRLWEILIKQSKTASISSLLWKINRVEQMCLQLKYKEPRTCYTNYFRAWFKEEKIINQRYEVTSCRIPGTVAARKGSFVCDHRGRGMPSWEVLCPPLDGEILVHVRWLTCKMELSLGHFKPTKYFIKTLNLKLA